MIAIAKEHARPGCLLPGRIVPNMIPVAKCSVAFVGASPAAIDAIRGEPFAGPLRRVLLKEYLEPASVDFASVALCNIVPVHLVNDDGRPREPTQKEIEKHRLALLKELERINPVRVVALGKTAAEALGSACDLRVPHPVVIANKPEWAYRVCRKMLQLRSAPLTKENRFATVETSEPACGAQFRFLTKSADEDQQLLGGVVLEPDVVDSQGDHETAEEIESTAHKYLKDSRKIGFRHDGILKDAFLVESHIVRDDRGFTVINEEKLINGTWFAVVHIADKELWQAVKDGLDEFSIGGDGQRTKDR